MASHIETWNMYAYVGDNPTTLNDPSGMAPPGSSGACGKESPNVCTQAAADGQRKNGWEKLLSIFYANHGNGTGVGFTIDVGVKVHAAGAEAVSVSVL